MLAWWCRHRLNRHICGGRATKPTLIASAVGKIMTFQRNTQPRSQLENRAGPSRAKREKRNHPKFKINICNGNDREGVCSRTDVRICGCYFYFEELCWNIKPTLDVPKQGRGRWFGFFPFFCSVVSQHRPFRYSPVVLCHQARPELPGLSHPTLTTLHRFSILAGHTSVIHDYFLDAHVVRTLQNRPGRNGKAEYSEAETGSVTAEVKWSHFLNFLLYTMDAGKQDNKAPQNKTQGCAPKESLDSSGTRFTSSCWGLGYQKDRKTSTYWEGVPTYESSVQ